MVSLSGVFSEVWGILEMIAPLGVDPVYFWATALITFAIIFAAAQYLPFMKDNKAIALIIALVMAYFTASSAFVTIIVSKMFPNIGLVLMAILGLLLVVAFMAPKSFDKGFTGTKFIAIAAFIFIIWLTYTFAAPQLQAQGYITGPLGNAISEEDIAVVVIVLILVSLGAMLIGKKEGSEESGIKKVFGSLFKDTDW